MNQSRPNAKTPTEAAPRRGEARRTEGALQPPPTGANRGSPAAPVMKQFVKTKTESGERS